MDYSAVINNLSPAVVYVLFVWSLIWKGIALWKSSRQDQRNWFIAMLVINTLGLIEIVYLFYFSKKRLTIKDLAFWNMFTSDSSGKKGK